MPNKKKSKNISDSNKNNSECIKAETDINIIHHPLQYESIHNSQQFLEASIEERVKILKDYITSRNKVQNEIARRSFTPAPLSQIYNIPIVRSSSINNDADDYNNNHNFSTIESDDENVLPQSKNQKSTRNVQKPGPANEEDDEIYFSDQRNIPIDVNVYDFSIENSSDESDCDVEYLPNGKSKKKPPAKRVKKKKKDTNEQKKKVVKKEKFLKSNSVPSLNTNLRVTSSRSEMLFDKLKEQEERKKKEDDVMEKFKKSLNELEIENTDSETDETKPETMFPVLAVKRNYKRKGSACSNETVPKKRSIKEKSTKTQSKPNDQPSTSQNDCEILQQCPLCGDNFPQNAIENHAEFCDEEVPVETGTLISCPICEKVILTPERLLSHRKNCERKN